MGHKWKEITPLSEKGKKTDLSDVASLHAAWQETKSRLLKSSPENLKLFSERLARFWSIETGILERVYDIDRGTTQVLIEQGFIAGLIERGNGNGDPDRLIRILRDHKAAVDLIQDCVANSRNLSIGLIHELHAIITRHQHIVNGEDQFGNPVTFELKHGTFKDHPNNPKRPDGSIHEYCPPIHVASEMEKLVNWYSESAGLHPVLLAAWLHHRFTQIHPYQDGNGRVARALANLVLVKSELFPIVVTRDHRVAYINALEKADSGDIRSLVRMFARIQKKTILEAVSVPADTKAMTQVVGDVTEAIAGKLRRRKEEKARKLRKVNSVAEGLQRAARKHLEILAQDVKAKLNSTAQLGLGVQVLPGGPGFSYHDSPTEHWYHFQVVKSARESNQRVNFEEAHYFIRTRLSGKNIPWLTHVVSFHHVGQELTGVIEVTAFAEISYRNSDEEMPGTEHLPCMDKPFTITFQDESWNLTEQFLQWVDECFALAVHAWGDIL